MLSNLINKFIQDERRRDVDAEKAFEANVAKNVEQEQINLDEAIKKLNEVDLFYNFIKVFRKKVCKKSLTKNWMI